MTQAQSYDNDGRRVLAWWLDTDRGRKATWAATADEARRKATALGLRVKAVRPRSPRI
jgi:hypothetical protein